MNIEDKKCYFYLNITPMYRPKTPELKDLLKKIRDDFRKNLNLEHSGISTWREYLNRYKLGFTWACDEWDWQLEKYDAEITAYLEGRSA